MAHLIFKICPNLLIYPNQSNVFEREAQLMNDDNKELLVLFLEFVGLLIGFVSTYINPLGPTRN